MRNTSNCPLWSCVAHDLSLVDVLWELGLKEYVYQDNLLFQSTNKSKHTFSSGIFLDFNNILATALTSQVLLTFHCLPLEICVTFGSTDNSGIGGFKSEYWPVHLKVSQRECQALIVFRSHKLAGGKKKKSFMKQLGSPSEQCDGRFKNTAYIFARKEPYFSHLFDFHQQLEWCKCINSAPQFQLTNSWHSRFL